MVSLNLSSLTRFNSGLRRGCQAPSEPRLEARPQAARQPPAPLDHAFGLRPAHPQPRRPQWGAADAEFSLCDRPRAQRLPRAGRKEEGPRIAIPCRSEHIVRNNLSTNVHVCFMPIIHRITVCTGDVSEGIGGSVEGGPGPERGSGGIGFGSGEKGPRDECEPPRAAL